MIINDYRIFYSKYLTKKQDSDYSKAYCGKIISTANVYVDKHIKNVSPELYNNIEQHNMILSELQTELLNPLSSAEYILEKWEQGETSLTEVLLLIPQILEEKEIAKSNKVKVDTVYEKYGMDSRYYNRLYALYKNNSKSAL